MEPFGERDATGLQAYTEELRATFMRLQDEGAELHAVARAVQVTEKSRDGLVSVTVGSRGELIRLDIDPRIYRRPDARALADSITETVRRAADGARERIIEVFEPLIPADQMKVHLDGDLGSLMTQLADQMGGKR
ncbi:YbaB/EbfC family nucleoid-associated protein [Streptosporangium lutulentum]|uniref:DNA-binding protein YbaB n=1 Tax=Streptosporangium lutulentum TaxID=1461250 RepID=A0ABT9QFV3_9ACTN|nr:YbaB/EbfC family nucleoid-associated protein [Streptosporangium lutulentum]MDP9845626.1 DNA-binding protein YbaB [Streptosporangium lutulentum]